jgi:hypothetical protein
MFSRTKFEVSSATPVSHPSFLLLAVYFANISRPSERLKINASDK